MSDDSETVKKILCDGLSPNAVYNRFNSSLLIRAAQYDAVESAKVLHDMKQCNSEWTLFVDRCCLNMELK